MTSRRRNRSHGGVCCATSTLWLLATGTGSSLPRSSNPPTSSKEESAKTPRSSKSRCTPLPTGEGDRSLSARRTPPVSREHLGPGGAPASARSPTRVRCFATNAPRQAGVASSGRSGSNTSAPKARSPTWRRSCLLATFWELRKHPPSWCSTPSGTGCADRPTSRCSIGT
jgi:hypothetical protein